MIMYTLVMFSQSSDYYSDLEPLKLTIEMSDKETQKNQYILMCLDTDKSEYHNGHPALRDIKKDEWLWVYNGKQYTGTHAEAVAYLEKRAKS